LTILFAELTTISSGHDQRIKLGREHNKFAKGRPHYKVDNEKLMKAKEEQDGFNIKLLQSLDRIEKKMDKETKTSRSRRQ
jgi:hypothetical protein